MVKSGATIGCRWALIQYIQRSVSIREFRFSEDVICFPEKLFDWISLWFESKKCKNFICTIKFQGSPDYNFAKKFLEIEGSQVVHLYNNKHELTFMHIHKNITGKIDHKTN